MEAIQNGAISTHSNFFSDPAAIGLVRQTPQGGRLTPAGRAFLQTKPFGYSNPDRAEYCLLKTLYYSRFNHTRVAARFLHEKKSHLENFLSLCSPTPARQLLLQRPKLLTVAEYISCIPTALLRLLQMDSTFLLQLAELGEPAFDALGQSDDPPGLSRFCHKIASDYTRASARRLHTLLSMALLAVRANLLAAQMDFDTLSIPYPFCNLLSETDLFKLAAKYTSDIEIAPDPSGYLVLLNEFEVAPPPATPVQTLVLRSLQPRTPRTRTTATIPQTRPPATSFIVVDAALSHHAESYFETHPCARAHGNALLRVGHTNLETVPLEDGLVPGADFIVGPPDAPQRFIEIKATRNDPPQSINLTRGEYLRAKRCHDTGVPYQMFVLTFNTPLTSPRLYEIKDFAALANSLTLSQLLSLHIPLHVSPH